MELIAYSIKRFFLMIPTLLGIMLVTFFIMKLAPGDPVMLKLRFAGEGLQPEALAALLKSEKPPIELPESYENFMRDMSRRLHGGVDEKTLQDAHVYEVLKWISGRGEVSPAQKFEDLGLADTRTHKSLKWIGENAVYFGKWVGNLVPLEWNPADYHRSVAEAKSGDSFLGAVLSYVKAPVQAVLRWPDFGLSQKDNRPVMTKIREKLPITLLINVLTVIVVYFVSIPLGIWSAIRHGSLLDKIVMVKLFIFYSLPTFWVATVLLMFFAGGDYLNFFPLMGYKSEYYEELNWLGKVADVGWHLFLPVLADTIGSFAFLTRFSRSNFLDVVRQDYMRTARAKGVSERKVLFKHGLRNALIPFVTLMGTLLPGLLGGSVVIEQIFNIPGMGMLSFEAVLGRDHNVIMGIATISAALTLIGLYISDVLYTFVDPRINLK